MARSCVLLDTSFFVRLLNEQDPLHLNTLAYYRHFLEKEFLLKISTISIAEYCVKGALDELPLQDVQVIPFNINHANYLSDLLKRDTGKNAQEHIHYHLIEKAKTLLLNSNGTISEVAYNLGFEYPQYFSKIFKLKTRMTPAEYRGNLN